MKGTLIIIHNVFIDRLLFGNCTLIGKFLYSLNLGLLCVLCNLFPDIGLCSIKYFMRKLSAKL